ncbi:uncharacterized protein L3040_006842 [Drepanopeziza brunnea f. sp. 'multigermtubi']|uniref:Uncharacterized protein n=1 Tax=Marssonina brunnea f. sp. multigermtubi (strain MB_m1) TaxID=1072389 RepID=K1X2B8_MARBU|nr:uncharacterized protein MBM_02608 [Drepanopeziza brunnea f. sp. 'multigermtubi' MB_m1]EKD19371.1 hypothetical protein MBM_02608 [Drepanopeziza brunnea f. sp. 'multigermtubi' MB_m1]KAJ5037966.1 hypothetical protein L3040_006842 [Drepanopeziza brunnea f. sp. 'multigermtubi']
MAGRHSVQIISDSDSDYSTQLRPYQIRPSFNTLERLEYALYNWLNLETVERPPQTQLNSSDQLFGDTIFPYHFRDITYLGDNPAGTSERIAMRLDGEEFLHLHCFSFTISTRHGRDGHCWIAEAKVEALRRDGSVIRAFVDGEYALLRATLECRHDVGFNALPMLRAVFSWQVLVVYLQNIVDSKVKGVANENPLESMGYLGDGVFRKKLLYRVRPVN